MSAVLGLAFSTVVVDCQKNKDATAGRGKQIEGDSLLQRKPYGPQHATIHDTSPGFSQNPTFSLFSLLKAWWMSSLSRWDHHGSCQHSQSALISSHAASKLCGHCGLARQCVFVSCGHHVVSFSKEPAILYSSRTVAQCAPTSLCKGSRS